MTTEYKLSNSSEQLFTNMLEHYTPLTNEQLANVFKLIIETNCYVGHREIGSFSTNKYNIYNSNYDELLLLIKDKTCTLYLSPSTIIIEKYEDIYVCYYNSKIVKL